MQPDAERDRAVEQALRRTLRASANEPMGEHVDGETLAAWTEGQVRADEAARIEQHLSDCARCQQMLASFARTSPPPIVSEPIWRRWRLQWLVPIATAATVAALWIAAPREQSRVSAPISDQTVPASPPATSNDAPQLVPSEPAPPTAQQRLRDTNERSAAKASDPSASSARGAFAAPLEKKEESTFDRRDSFEVTAVPQPGAAAADAGARDEQERRKLAEAVQLSRETAATSQPTAAPPAAAAPAAPPAPSAARALPRTTANAVPTLAGRAFSAQPDVVSPNSAIRWRIVNGTRVERTTNGGGDWQTATLPSTSLLTAGSSPASAVCWIVGRGGTVLITTDGVRFSRVKFPESVDLVSVTATDDRHATVMSADGRTFRTEDQGMTWTR